MEIIIQNIQTRLSEVAELKYIDEDWGQLDYYSPNFPVKWPCTLIDVPSANFSNLGTDKKATPINRQNAGATLSITVANMKLSNTSLHAPQTQKDNAWSVHGLIEKIHGKLQGFMPKENAGKLIRTGLERVKRDDGVQEYNISYSFDLYNV